MKNLALIALVAGILVMASCKKEQPQPQPQNQNNNNQNNNNNVITDTARTGLGLLANKSADNYAVLIVGPDTMIWQNTNGDSLSLTGGTLYSFPDFKAMGPFMQTQLDAKVIKPPFKSFMVRFQKADSTSPMNPACSVSDGLVLPGPVTISTPRLNMSITDNQGNILSTWDDNTAAPFQIVSATKIETSTGCYKLRVKARFSSARFHLYECVVSFDVSQAEFQMDFQL